VVPVRPELRWTRQDAAGLQLQQVPRGDAGTAERLPLRRRRILLFLARPQSADARLEPALRAVHRWRLVRGDGAAGYSSWARHDDEDSLSGTKLWYRGRNILDAVLDDLLARRGLEQATDVVLSGCSAGGLAIYLNADHVASKLPSGAKFRAIADSGYFLRAAGNVVGMQWVAKAMNVSTNIACERAEKDPTECIFAQVRQRILLRRIFCAILY